VARGLEVVTELSVEFDSVTIHAIIILVNNYMVSCTVRFDRLQKHAVLLKVAAETGVTDCHRECVT
jgi:hypothetical protein